MKKVGTVYISLLFCCFYSNIYSQFSRSQYHYSYNKSIEYEIGGGIAAMNCITDIGGANGDKTYYINEIRSRNFRPAISIYAGVSYNNYLAARIEGTLGQIRAADNDIKSSTPNAYSRQIRGLSFRSNIYEVCLLFEFHPVMLINREGNKWFVDPYVTAGIGFFSYNPQTQYKGNWVDLKPLHTEGEGFPEYPTISNYKLSQANIPVGIGVRYNVSDKINLRLEYLHRILFTDYLDDVSSRKFVDPSVFDKNLPPALAADAKALYNRSENVRISVRRGNPNNNDTYMSLSLKAGLTLGR